ncbi:MAG TPA: hypothetical protein PLM49_04085 [Bacteroidales bacterium]|nr:hypothetical protein [Bacteroidales bacterium]
MFEISKPAKIVIFIILAMIGSSLLVAYLYYSAKNRAEDPRMVRVKKNLARFDEICASDGFDKALLMLADAEKILKNTAGYADSYELGIVYNNMASVYLQQAIYESSDSSKRVTLFVMADSMVQLSVNTYSNWMMQYGTMPVDSLKWHTLKTFNKNDEAFEGYNYEKIVNKRVDDLLLAQNETPRRLSVAYTNQGIVRRHQYRQQEAIECYVKAIELWKDNYTARNNFNVLMGLPPEDRSIVDQLFPPEKNKFD